MKGNTGQGNVIRNVTTRKGGTLRPSLHLGSFLLARSTHLLALRAICLCVAFVLLALALSSLLPAGAFAYDTGKVSNQGDPSTGTTTITIRQSSKDESWKLIPTWSDSPGTRYRWNEDEYAYCINPSCGTGHRDGEYESFAARVLASGDFARESDYWAMLALLYYSPSGPGYATLGKSIWDRTDYQGKKMDEQTIFGMAHVLMGYYYNGCDWRATWFDYYSEYKSGSGDVGSRIPGSFKSWCYEQLIPNTSSDTTGSQVGALCNLHATDEEMVVNGGYTMEEWAKHVYLVLTGGTEHDTYQDFITWDGRAPGNGTITLAKTSADTALTKDNPCYSLASAVYGIYTDASCTKLATSLSTGAEGSATTQIAPGKYFVKETKASSGYALDAKVYPALVGTGRSVKVESNEVPLAASPSIAAAKVDADTSAAKAQGAATLKGAQITVRYYPGYHAAAQLPAKAERTWVFTTAESGVASFDRSSLVSGTLYSGSGGKAAIPLGTIAIQETAAPNGYRLDDGLDGTPKVYVAQVRAEDGAARIVPLNYTDNATVANTPVIPDSVKRIGVRVEKTDGLLDAQPQGDASLEGALFEVVNQNEGDVVVAGKRYSKGQACATMKSAHAGDTYIAALDGDSLPYGNYLVREKEAPQGYLLNSEWSARVTVDANTKDGTVIDLTESPCANLPVKGGISLEKLDRETQGSHPLAAASLADAQISIALASDGPVVVDGKKYERGDVVATISTDAEGHAKTAPDLLPYASYLLQETKPPEGYLANAGWKATVAVRGNGELVESEPVDDQVKRGDIRFNKVADEGMKRLGNVAFLVTSKTTGESHVLVADENGSVDTSSGWAPHTNETNANDDALIFESEKRTPDGKTDETSAATKTISDKADVDASDPDADAQTQESGDAASNALAVAEASTAGDADLLSPQAESATPSTNAVKDPTDPVEETIASGAESAKEAESTEEEVDAKIGQESEPSQGGDTRFEVDDELLDSEHGIWFTGGNDEALPDDGLGALPYDTYEFRELSSAANDGYQLVSFEVRVSRNDYDLDMGSVDDGALYEPPEEPEPEEPTPEEPAPEPPAEQPDTPQKEGPPEDQPAEPAPAPQPRPSAPEAETESPAEQAAPKIPEQARKTASKASTATKSPKTGDSNPALIWFVALAAIAAVTAAFAAWRRIEANATERSWQGYGAGSRIIHALDPRSSILRAWNYRRSTLAACALIATAALAVLLVLAHPAFADSGMVTIESSEDTQTSYLLFPIFGVEGDETEHEEESDDQDSEEKSDEILASKLRWESDDIQEIVCEYLALDDTGADLSYDTWLELNDRCTGPGDSLVEEDRMNPQNASEYLMGRIDITTTTAAGDSIPQQTRNAVFASNFAAYLLEAGADSLRADSGVPFTAEAGLYLFWEAPSDDETPSENGSVENPPMWLPLGYELELPAEKTPPSAFSFKARVGDDAEFSPFASAQALQDITFCASTTLPQNVGSYGSFHWRMENTLPEGLQLASNDASSIAIFVGDQDITPALEQHENAISYSEGKLVTDIPDILALKEIDALEGGAAVRLEYRAHIQPGVASGILRNEISYIHTAGPLAAGDVVDTLGGTAFVGTFEATITTLDASNGTTLPETAFSVQWLPEASVASNAEGADSDEGAAEDADAPLYLQEDGSLGSEPYPFSAVNDGVVTLPSLGGGNYLIQCIQAPDGYEPFREFTLGIHPLFDNESATVQDLGAGISESVDEEGSASAIVAEANTATGSIAIKAFGHRLGLLSLVQSVPPQALALCAGGTAIGLMSILAIVIAILRRPRTGHLPYPEPSPAQVPAKGIWQYW